MNIPESIKLFGIIITVKVIPIDDWRQEAECVGIYYEQQNEIQLLERADRSAMAQVFLHELLHAILTMLRYDKLSNDEKLIDTVASLLHQALTSAEYSNATRIL